MAVHSPQSDRVLQRFLTQMNARYRTAGMSHSQVHLRGDGTIDRHPTAPADLTVVPAGE